MIVGSGGAGVTLVVARWGLIGHFHQGELGESAVRKMSWKISWKTRITKSDLT